MPDTQQIETTPAETPDESHQGEIRLGNASLRAAAAEAAYILEAVRK
jgi:hypothetical protein